jgi:hypothetical protein
MVETIAEAIQYIQASGFGLFAYVVVCALVFKVLLTLARSA